jgi:mannitol/fructose-specific phosphotransferase system IIA component (Ntr-type)
MPENNPTIAQYTTPGLLIPQLSETEPVAVIRELCLALEREGRLTDPASFRETVIRNERQRSTAMSPGWALPHARSSGLTQLSFALGRSVTPIEWFGESAERVHMVFLFSVPEAAAANYLALVSGLARLNQDPAQLEKLFCAPDGAAMFEILGQIELRQPRPPRTKPSKS